MRDACTAVGIRAPRRVIPGRWIAASAEGKAASNSAGRVLVFDDRSGGIAWNWITQAQQRFTVDGLASLKDVRLPRRDQTAEALERDRQAAAIEAARRMVAAAQPEPHPYLARKGFAEERGLVLDAPGAVLPADRIFDGMRYQLEQMTAPFLIIPGRIAKRVMTTQLIDAAGAKLNMKAAPMAGATHRIATGRETWICEGIATALSVRAALRLLARPATILCAFSAANVAKISQRIPGSIIAADHDRPLEQLHGQGTGAFYAARTGRVWTQPPEPGDFNDWHMRDGLRAVALHLREVRPP
jgi:putative DNA primase/helicase